MKINGKIYMDYQATTPVDERVFDEMMPFFKEEFGNASSKSHEFGWNAKDAVEKARHQIQTLINASDSSEIIFTSGATESNNLALIGLCEYLKSNESKKNKIITMSTEHPCIIASCEKLEKDGYKIVYLDPESNGILNIEKLKNEIDDETIMVSIMGVNNEIGVIQPLKEIGQITRSKGVVFHTDCAQAFGKIPLDVEEMNIDMMSISGHKIYGPKGIGALYVRKKPRVRLRPIMFGGGQERGLRSGTLPTALIVGLGKAAEISFHELHSDLKKIKELSDYFIEKVFSELTHVSLNGDRHIRYPGCVNISFAGIEGESLLMSLQGIALSTGSACSSHKLESSSVISALGTDDYLAHTNIRFGFGRFTTKDDVDYVLEKLISGVNKLRDMSPIWEMLQNGTDLSSISWKSH